MVKYLTVALLLVAVSVGAQEVDTKQEKSIREFRAQIDSLRLTIKLMDRELQRMKREGGRGRRSMDELITQLDDDEEERSPLYSRSRRRRVDVILRAITQRPGQLRFNGGSTAILQHGYQDGGGHTTGTGSFDICAHTAFGPNSLLFLDLEAIGGNGLDEYYSTFGGLNGDAGSTQAEDGTDRLTVLEAWVEFALLDRIFTVTAGKIDLTNYFDNNAAANDETTQFISGAFVNSSAFAVPANAPGVRFRTTLIDRFHLQLGLSSADNSGADLLSDVYRIASVGFTLLPGSGYESNIRLYGYQHPLADNAEGWGVSFENVSFGAVDIFARYGRNEAAVADYWGVESAWSAGATFARKVAGRTTVLGAAYGENGPRPAELRTERITEIYVRHRLNEWASLSPHVQVVWNAGGSSEQITIFGVRTHFNF